MWIIKTIILLALLLYASVRDIKTREVPDSISVLLLILGFVDTDIERLPSMIIGALLVFLPQFASALINPSKALGGADVKISLFVMLLICSIRKVPKDQPFPLIPFISIGIVAGYFI